MPAPRAIIDLIERFDRNIDQYKKAQNETQVRREFIDPFFTELGWDMDNRHGAAPQYQDVIHEDQIKIGGRTKAPDYGFRIGGTLKFFVEAKKPSIIVKDAPGPAYQVRSYAWSAKLPLSLVTDFEEFAVYDCSQKPNEGDKPSIARVNYLTYKEYIEKWDEIEQIFSKDAILRGSFDKYAEGAKGKRGTTTVDKAFLQEIERFRELLAKNFAKHNRLSEEELKFAVQRTLDRIIFLRICESRGIEEEGRLLEVVTTPQPPPSKEGGVYERLFTLFHAADNRYNSGLFYFRKGDKSHTSDAELDTITPKLQLDDKILKDIVEHLYYPKSPYQFDVVPADILGQVYEQFLGKVIRMTSGGMVKIEEKPEVRKAGGVYYTPTYIVDYIVKNTVGKKLEEMDLAVILSRSEAKAKNPSKKATNGTLNILDPACGSGSFLLGAYDYLLKWYHGEYSKNKEYWLKQKNAPVFAIGDAIQLTTPERKRILLEHIHGVDIDEQAVEVAKLNLMLKCLEGESRQNLKLSVERLLPDLSDNIKCGNSLIGPDFYSSGLFEDGKDVNAFDWNIEFADIMKSGGFDTVIGNPPYGAGFSEPETLYLRSKYTSAKQSTDSYILFMELAAVLLKEGGAVGEIVQSGWVSAPTASSLRHSFKETFSPNSFVALPYDVFGAYVDTMVYTASRLPINPASKVDLVVFPPKFKIRNIDDFQQFQKTANISEVISNSRSEFLTVLSSQEIGIVNKLLNSPKTFANIADIQRGVTPFHLNDTPPKNSAIAFNGQLRRYTIEFDESKYLRYDETLAEFKPGRYFTGPRILLRELISRQFRLQASFVNEDFITNKSIQSILITPPLNPLFVLGILNSKLISWFFLSVNSVGRRDDFPKIVLKQTRELPFPDIELDPKNKLQEKVCALVERMILLQKEVSRIGIPTEKTRIERQILATDAEIDRLVYELYGLTEEEIKIVESN